MKQSIKFLRVIFFIFYDRKNDCVQQNVYFATVGSFFRANWILLDLEEYNDPISADNHHKIVVFC